MQLPAEHWLWLVFDLWLCKLGTKAVEDGESWCPLLFELRLSLTLPLPDEAEEAEELTEIIEWGRLLLRLSESIDPHTECRNFGAIQILIGERG